MKKLVMKKNEFKRIKSQLEEVFVVTDYEDSDDKTKVIVECNRKMKGLCELP